MASDEAYQKAEEIIAESWHTKTTKLDLSFRHDAQDSAKHTELPE